MDIDFLKAPLQVYLVKTMITGKGSYRSIVGRRKQGSNERRRRRQEFLERETELQEKEEEEVGGMEGLRRKSRWFHHQQWSLSFTIQNWTQCIMLDEFCPDSHLPPVFLSAYAAPFSPVYMLRSASVAGWHETVDSGLEQNFVWKQGCYNPSCGATHLSRRETWI